MKWIRQKGKTLDGLKHELLIDNVHFSYIPGKEILHGVTIKVDKGEMVALVGPTGSGKTTVMNLLNRFYDVDSGRLHLTASTFANSSSPHYDKMSVLSCKTRNSFPAQFAIIFASAIPMLIRRGWKQRPNRLTSTISS